MYLHRDTKERISEKEYNMLPDFEQDQYGRYPIAKYYNVFNLDLTDYPEKYPEDWAKLLDHYQKKVKLNEAEMFDFPLLDRLIEEQSWDCPINLQIQNRAFYNLTEDHIWLPVKRQFASGESFYGTLLHEMSHSTGHQERLKRKMGERCTPGYAKEELIAELSSALLGYFMGIETNISQENAAYLKYWIEELNSEVDFLMDVLSDVVKVVNYTIDKTGFELPDEINITQPAKESTNKHSGKDCRRSCCDRLIPPKRLINNISPV